MGWHVEKLTIQAYYGPQGKQKGVTQDDRGTRFRRLRIPNQPGDNAKRQQARSTYLHAESRRGGKGTEHGRYSWSQE